MISPEKKRRPVSARSLPGEIPVQNIDEPLQVAA